MFKTIVLSLCLLIGISANAQSKIGIDFQKIDLEAAKNGVTTFGWTQKLSPHALSLRHEKQEKELQFRV